MQGAVISISDKRIHDRTECRTEAIVETDAGSFNGEVENLSLKGLFVKTNHILPIDTVVKVTVKFSGESSKMSFSMDARVVRTDSTGIGLNFRRIDINSLLVQKMNSIGQSTVSLNPDN